MGFRDYLEEDVKTLQKNINEDKIKGFVGTFNIDEFVLDSKAVSTAEKEIADKVKKLTGAKCNITISRERDRLVFKSEKLKQTPRMFETLIVSSFNSDVSKDNGYWWFTCHFDYKHFNGGSNGSAIFTGWILPNGKLTASRDWQ